jgi:hypothetical protein
MREVKYFGLVYRGRDSLRQFFVVVEASNLQDLEKRLPKDP